MQSGHRDTTAFKTQQTPQNHRYLASNLRSKLQRPVAGGGGGGGGGGARPAPPPPFGAEQTATRVTKTTGIWPET